MKNIGLVIVAFLTIFSQSCNDFLDVSSSNEMLEDEIFGTNTGIRLAVNGVYRSLSSTDLYGRNLSWGFISAIGHNYVSSSTSYLPQGLYYGAAFDWENSSVKSFTESIWKSAFKVIAEANNILQEVEKKDDSFFEIEEYEKKMILGEMYAIRAFMHFDLCRLFCASPKSGGSTKMPYVTKYPDRQPEHKDMNVVLDEIIRDMEMAKDLLAPVDTIFCKSWIRSLNNRMRVVGVSSSAIPNLFFNHRGTRMNYFGVTALLARMYMYQGNLEKAYENAIEVYDNMRTYSFTWTSASYQGLVTNVDYIYTKRYSELFLCFYNNENYNNWELYLSSYPYYYRMKNMDKLFEDDPGDYRLVGWYNRYGDYRYLTWVRPQGTGYPADDVAKNQGPIIPIIRMSELFHILTEYYINIGDLVQAAEYLNTVRTNRGLRNNIEIDPDEVGRKKEELTEMLSKKLLYDIIRESLTEGQTFYLYKRLNQGIFNGETDIIMQPSDWYPPLPDSEIAYQ